MAVTHPTDIRQLGPAEMGISWSDGHESIYQVRDLRLSCRCAVCVEELTGVRRLSADSVPQDIRPVEVTPVGNYAIHIVWTDGHQSGIFTFQHLRENCQCDECKSSKGGGD